eukprot:Hpha_TRINITY_DN4256_c0_g2::TRINITY_DN4256_c0_g2_i1::g.186565::m.186565
MAVGLTGATPPFPRVFIGALRRAAELGGTSRGIPTELLRHYAARLPSVAAPLHKSQRPRLFAGALRALHNNGESEGVRELLTELVRVAQDAGCGAVSPVETADALFGLGRQPDAPEVREVLEWVAKFGTGWDGPVGAWELGSSLLGLRQRTFVPPALGAMLCGLALLCPTLSPSAVTNALHGLGLAGGSVEGRKIVSVLGPLIYGCRGRFRSEQLVSICQGVQRLPNLPEVRTLLEALALSFSRSSLELTGDDVGVVLRCISAHLTPQGD